MDSHYNKLKDLKIKGWTSILIVIVSEQRFSLGCKTTTPSFRIKHTWMPITNGVSRGLRKGGKNLAEGGALGNTQRKVEKW